jgi:tetraacyldisaccharide 4'-kinase
MYFFKKILFPFIIPMTWLYGCTIWVRNQFYNLGWIKITSFDKPVISVGNITSGGTGKTPLVIYLAQLLLKNGKKPGIISRGYGRQSQGIQIVHDGNKLLIDAKTSGDEPCLMARVLKKVPVVVCEDRSRGISQLLDYYSVNVIIMDDSFQHRKVNRDLDILTVSSNDKKTDYRLLPWGNLREPLKNINRANYVIYTKTENHKTPAIHSKFQPFLKTNPINSSLLPTLMKYNASNYRKSLPPVKPIFAFCGIADPNSFINTAEKLSLKVEDRKFFQDHQEYTESVIQKLSEQIRVSSIIHVVTTEKDMVKLPESFLEEFEVYVIKVDVVFENELIIKDIIQPILLN